LDKVINIEDIHLSGSGLSGHDELRVLVRDCIAQSRSAQKKLYDLYAPEAYGIIKRLIYNNESLADELLNLAFYKIFKDLEKYGFRGAFEGWVRRIVVYTVADHLRKNIKIEPHREVQPDDAYIHNESVERISHKEILKIITTLPEVQRNVFNLFVFEDYSHKEIAELLDINENNCRWYLNDARRRLKEKINALTDK